MKSIRIIRAWILLLTTYPMGCGMIDLFTMHSRHPDYFSTLTGVLMWWAFTLVPPIFTELKERKLKKDLNLPEKFIIKWSESNDFPELKYFAISPSTNQIAFYQEFKKISRIESLDFVTNWESITTESSTGKIRKFILRIYFNDYDYPYMELEIYGSDALRKYKQFEIAMQGEIDKSSFHPSKIYPEYFAPDGSRITPAAPVAR